MWEITRRMVDERLVSELTLAENAKEVSVPYPDPEFLCPNCEKTIPTRLQRNLAKPARYAHRLNDVQKCPYCSFVFSYRSRAVVIRE